jgi:hypothetical protein
VEQVWQQVIADLTAAKPDLVPNHEGGDRGRATQGAATALLGKVYMQQRRWAEAATQFNETHYVEPLPAWRPTTSTTS